MKTFDRTSLRELRKDLETALKAVEEQHGISLDIGNMRFSADECRFSTTATIGEGEDKSIAAKITFDKHCWMYDLTTEDFGKTFLWGRSKQPYVISGLNLRGKKYNVCATNTKGEEYRFAADDVKRLLPNKPTPKTSKPKVTVTVEPGTTDDGTSITLFKAGSKSEEIHQYIIANPKATKSQIAKALDTHYSVVDRVWKKIK